MNKFTTEMKDYVKNNHKGKSTIELSKEINDLLFYIIQILQYPKTFYK